MGLLNWLGIFREFIFQQQKSVCQNQRVPEGPDLDIFLRDTVVTWLISGF